MRTLSKCGQDPLEAYEMLSPYISYIHVKDALFATSEVVPAGTGDGHLLEIFQKSTLPAITAF